MGVAIVEGGRLVDQRSWLIRPPGNIYDEFNMQLHGIGPDDTEHAPDFADVFAEACRVIGDRPILAHYAPFDVGVIRAEHFARELACPAFRIACTVVLSRRAWPGLTSYSLRPLATFLGLETLAAHDASADARLCAEVGRCVIADTEDDGLEGAAERLRVSLGILQPYTSCHARSDDWNLIEPRPCDIDPDHPFFDADVAFTGGLLSMPRRIAAQLVVSAGGRFSKSVTRQTEFLVFGQQDFWKFGDGEKSAKTHTYEKLVAQGYPIQIIGEDDFLRMIDAGKS